MKTLFVSLVALLLSSHSPLSFSQENPPVKKEADLDFIKDLGFQEDLVDLTKDLLRSPKGIPKGELTKISDAIQTISEASPKEELRSKALELNIQIRFKYDTKNAEEALARAIKNNLRTMDGVKSVSNKFSTFDNTIIVLGNYYVGNTKRELAAKLIDVLRKEQIQTMIKIRKFLNGTIKNTPVAQVLELRLLRSQLIEKVVQFKMVEESEVQLKNVAAVFLVETAEKSKKFNEEKVKKITADELRKSYMDILVAEMQEKAKIAKEPLSEEDVKAIKELLAPIGKNFQENTFEDIKEFKELIEEVIKNIK